MVMAGRLRHRVTLKSNSPSVDEYGDESESWGTEGTVWARIEPLRGQELLLAQQVNAELSHRVTIRYYSGCSPQWRVYFGNRTLEIVSVRDPEERNIKMELLCKEIQ
jgi:SPP1 family predicted phage head-tail adaptor